MQTRQMNGHMDMTKLTVAFRNFVNAPTKSRYHTQIYTLILNQWLISFSTTAGEMDMAHTLSFFKIYVM
jgi:hypothetical protein